VAVFRGSVRSKKTLAGPSWRLYQEWLERHARLPLRYRGQEQKQQQNMRGGKETKDRVRHRQTFCLQEADCEFSPCSISLASSW